MRGLPKEGSFAPLKTSKASGTDASVTITLAAVEGERHVVRQIDLSVRTGVPSTLFLSVSISGVRVWGVGLPLLDNQRPYHYKFPNGLYDKDSLNQTVSIQIGLSGVSSTVAKLNVLYE